MATTCDILPLVKGLCNANTAVYVQVADRSGHWRQDEGIWLQRLARVASSPLISSLKLAVRPTPGRQDWGANQRGDPRGCGARAGDVAGHESAAAGDRDDPPT